MLKMYTKGNKWIVVDGEKTVEFDEARDAWEFVFLMKSIRPNAAPKAPKSLYPVTTLNPFPSRKQKKIIFTFS
jgi:hypothetical protein